jgi:ubiquinone/menaquinone biosynthesis C-methylase UbiE
VSAKKARIAAVDIYPPSLEGVKEHAKITGVSDRIRTVLASMDELPFSPVSFDLIWAEGSIFILGPWNGITSWKQFLKPEGFFGFTKSHMVHKYPLRKSTIFLAGKLSRDENS